MGRNTKKGKKKPKKKAGSGRKRGRPKGLNKLTYRVKRNLVHERKVKWMEVRMRMSAMLDKILEDPEAGWTDRPTKNANKVDLLFMYQFPDPKARRLLLFRIFSRKFKPGDEVFLRCIWDYTRNAKKHSLKHTHKYFPFT